MSQQNVELVKTLQPTDVDLVELFVGNEAGVQTALNAFPTAAFADDFSVQFIAADALLLEYRGVEGMVEGWRDWLAAWASYRMVADDFIDAGDEVVVFARISGRTARDGVLVEHSPTAIWSIRDGKVVAIRLYLKREEALEAAGLSDQGQAQP